MNTVNNPLTKRIIMMTATHLRKSISMLKVVGYSSNNNRTHFADMVNDKYRRILQQREDFFTEKAYTPSSRKNAMYLVLPAETFPNP